MLIHLPVLLRKGCVSTTLDLPGTQGLLSWVLKMVMMENLELLSLILCGLYSFWLLTSTRTWLVLHSFDDDTVFILLQLLLHSYCLQCMPNWSLSICSCIAGKNASIASCTGIDLYNLNLSFHSDVLFTIFNAKCFGAICWSYGTLQVASTDHLVKESSYETSSGCFTVPQRTTSVFVEAHDIWECFFGTRRLLTNQVISQPWDQNYSYLNKISHDIYTNVLNISK